MQGIAHDQNAPPLANPFQATGDRAFGMDEGLALHGSSLRGSNICWFGMLLS
jgi:hypothetical protein